MPATRALAIVSLAAAALGAPGCRSSGDAGQFFGALLGTAAYVAVESYSNDDDFDYDDHHHRETEHRCRRRR